MGGLVMEKDVFYSGLLQGISAVKVNTRGIEGILHFSSYSPLGRQSNEIRPAEELEDPPEALHTPWGVWLHRNDALHKLDQKYDTEHVLRAAKAADDILHYANYVPKTGKDEDEIKPHETNFDYTYSHEEFVYSINTELDKEVIEKVEANINTALEEEPTNPNDKNEGTNNNERENLSIDENLKCSHDNVKKDLVEIIKTSKGNLN